MYKTCASSILTKHQHGEEVRNMKFHLSQVVFTNSLLGEGMSVFFTRTGISTTLQDRSHVQELVGLHKLDSMLLSGGEEEGEEQRGRGKGGKGRRQGGRKEERGGGREGGWEGERETMQMNMS